MPNIVYRPPSLVLETEIYSLTHTRMQTSSAACLACTCVRVRVYWFSFYIRCTFLLLPDLVLTRSGSLAVFIFVSLVLPLVSLSLSLLLSVAASLNAPQLQLITTSI